mgnify:FL=1
MLHQKEPGVVAFEIYRKGQSMKNILDYLEKTAQDYPGRTAVDDGKTRLTWSGLTMLSKRFGTEFCKKTDRGEPVVILAEKSSYTLAAMFGAVYAGCFYVNVDPAQPPARVGKILGMLRAKLVVTEQGHGSILDEAGYQGERVFLGYIEGDNILKEGEHMISSGYEGIAGNSSMPGESADDGIDSAALQAVREQSRDTDILYGIFTSGSTGVPKGVIVNQRAVIDFIGHFIDTFGFSAEDVIGNQAPFDFDVSVKDIYTSVMTGAKLVIIPKSMFSTPPVLLDYLCEKKVTALIWAVSALTLVSSLKGLRYRVPKDVRKVLFSGEVMPVRQLRLWQAALPETEFVNLYGPSEITCNCTYYPVRRIFEDREKLPIGRAFPGRDVFLLDEEDKEVTEAGKTGEICVSGESLADGYYGQPDETAKRFVYRSRGRELKRCYKTGDLGYFDGDGEIYFSGRKDFQIKHMGHRIELEEIERAMDEVAGVEQSCCVLDEKQSRLAAFYLGKTEPEEIRREMKKRFPIYMVPHKIIQIQAMPLNKNGKTDRAYLKKRLEVKG